MADTTSVCPSGIYAITNTLNGKQYIGSTANLVRRWSQHQQMLNQGTHHSRHLQRAWRKYGAVAFAFVVLEYVSDLDQLIAREQHYMDKRYETKDTIEYNSRPAAKSNLGHHYPPEVLAEMLAKRDATLKRRPHSLARIREGGKGRDRRGQGKGRTFSTEHRESHRKAIHRYWSSDQSVSRRVRLSAEMKHYNQKRRGSFTDKQREAVRRNLERYYQTVSRSEVAARNGKARKGLPRTDKQKSVLREMQAKAHSPEATAKWKESYRSHQPSAKQLAYWKRLRKTLTPEQRSRLENERNRRHRKPLPPATQSSLWPEDD